MRASTAHPNARLRVVLGVAVAAGALAPAACGGATSGDTTAGDRAPAEVVRLALGEENDSGHSGQAVLAPTEAGPSGVGGSGGEGIRVSIRLTPDTGESNPAHIHEGTCAEYRAMNTFSARLATVEDDLQALDAGRSETEVPVALADRTTGRFSINVHEPERPFDVIACGDIPRR